MERVITAANAPRLRWRILAEGANGPTTPDADAVLDQRCDEIFVIPDILCNSGGVIVSYFEWVQDLQRLFWSEAEVNSRLESLLDSTFDQVRARSGPEGVEPHRGHGDRRREGAGREDAEGVVSLIAPSWAQSKGTVSSVMQTTQRVNGPVRLVPPERGRQLWDRLPTL